MNRYLADGMIADLQAGKRILLVTSNRACSANALAYLVSREPDGVRGLHRASGQERIVGDKGGEIRIVSLRSQGHRGMSADTVVLDIDDSDRTPERLEEYVPAIAAVSGEIIYR